MTNCPLTISHSEGDITITHARLTTGQPISLHDHLLAKQECNTLLNPGKTNPCNPLNKYTNDDMPKVHVTDPMAILNLIDINLVIEWENYTNRKLLTIPFGINADLPKNHNHIVEKLLTVATEITQSDSLGISTPTPSNNAIRNEKTPTSFLIYNLTLDEIDLLMQ